MSSDRIKGPSGITSRPPDQAPPVSGRRRLLQGGLGAAPVLMTLVSRPVLGQTCTSPSGFVSATASHPGAAICTGRTPSNWAALANAQWPIPQSTLFSAQFQPSNFGTLGAQTLLAVVQGNGTSGNPTTDTVAQAVVAALLNAMTPGLTPPLSVAAVRDIWSEYGNTGAGTAGIFTPTAGAVWHWDEILGYLRTTW